MSDTKIEYLDRSWNPIAMRCTPVSPGCANCWHLPMAARHAANPAIRGEIRAARAGGPPWLNEQELLTPLKWRKPCRVGVQFMGDLFHEAVPFEFIDRVWAVMALCPRHTFMVLTKRPGRMREYLTRFNDREAWAEWLGNAAFRVTGDEEADCWVFNAVSGASRPKHPVGWPMAHVWLGATAEDQPRADERIPLLLQCPAAVRFISAEPCLGAIDAAPYLAIGRIMDCPCGHRFWSETAHPCNCNPPCGCRSAGECMHSNAWTLACPKCGQCACERIEKWRQQGRLSAVEGTAYDECLDAQKWHRGIDWVICGGESGPGARPMHPDWARSLRDQCVAAGVPYFLKQLSVDGRMVKMPALDGKVWAEFPK